MSLADLRTRFADFLRDPSAATDAPAVSSADRDRCIAAAVKRYSRDVPRWVLNSNGDGQIAAFVAGTTAYTVPARWVVGVSTSHPTEGIEVPVGRTPPSYLRLGEHYAIRQTADETWTILFLLSAPSAAFRFKFSIPHAVTEAPAVDTTLPNDSDAIAMLAVSIALREVATGFAYTVALTLSADAVNYQSKPSMFKGRADDLEKLYTKLVLGDEKTVAAASLVAQQYKNFTWGTGRLLHPRGSWAGSTS